MTLAVCRPGLPPVTSLAIEAFPLTGAGVQHEQPPHELLLAPPSQPWTAQPQ